MYVGNKWNLVCARGNHEELEFFLLLFLVLCDSEISWLSIFFSFFFKSEISWTGNRGIFCLGYWDKCSGYFLVYHHQSDHLCLCSSKKGEQLSILINTAGIRNLAGKTTAPLRFYKSDGTRQGVRNLTRSKEDFKSRTTFLGKETMHGPLFPP